MKKKGFTLVELLAVIAILAILVIIALPNVMGMFNSAKKNSFSNELKIIVSTAEKEYFLDNQFGGNKSSVVYSRIDTDYCNKKLSLNGRKNIDFYLEMDSTGKIVRYYASDGTYEYASEKYGLSVEDIQVENIKESGLDGEKLVISCDSPEYKPNGTITSLISGKEINIKMKTLAGNSNPTIETVDTNITGFVKSNTQPIEANKQAINIISIEDSKSPVYMWYESGTIKYYSEDDTIYFNRDSSYMFNRLTSLSNITALENFNTSHVRNFEYLFYRCSGINSIESLRNWNISNVNNMFYMFGGTGENQMHITDLTPLRNWNTSNVTNMSRIFQGNVDLESLEGLENWDTSNVTLMHGLFLASGNIYMHIKSLTPLRNWNTSKVTDMGGMFQSNIDLTSLEGLENWDTSNVTRMSNMFASSHENMHIRSLTPLRNWKTGKVTEMKSMFQLNVDIENLNGLENWDTSNVEDFGWFLFGCTGLKEANLSNFDLSKVKYFPGRVDSGGSLRQSGADMFSSTITNFEKFTTPASFPTDSRVILNLPKKMYDSEGNEYRKLDFNTPTNIELTSTRP